MAGVTTGFRWGGALIAAQTEAAWNERGMVTSVVYGARMLGGALMVAALGGTLTLEDPEGPGTVAVLRFPATRLVAPATLPA